MMKRGGGKKKKKEEIIHVKKTGWKVQCASVVHKVQLLRFELAFSGAAFL